MKRCAELPTWRGEMIQQGTMRCQLPDGHVNGLPGGGRDKVQATCGGGFKQARYRLPGGRGSCWKPPNDGAAAG